ncbi:hypothetical protein RIR_jg8583.t1 [Rhizophagus irregularis DAOM 181602=DAOM 197198]|nr:hypothetical protein RIR_jg8583.t1 [Rhizophagus irregularis DAOM 181602=DAOM 197198]
MANILSHNTGDNASDVLTEKIRDVITKYIHSCTRASSRISFTEKNLQLIISENCNRSRIYHLKRLQLLYDNVGEAYIYFPSIRFTIFLNNAV